MTLFQKLVLRLLHAILFRLIETTKPREGLPGMSRPREMEPLKGEEDLLAEVEKELE